MQGVSQQSAAERRDTQCDAQFDCINSPLTGCSARAGADVVSYHSGIDLTGAYCWEIVRGTTEHYLATLKAGVFEVFDLNTGALCTVTNSVPGGDTYLTNISGGPDKDAYRSQSVQDYTFFINKSIAPAFTSSVTASRPPECLLFFQSGNYLTTYGISINYNGTLYTFTYKTPDNSVVGNAAYIWTNQLAATFYRAFTGINPTTNNGNTPGGVGSAGLAGDPGGSGSGTTSVVVAPCTLQSLGFSVQLDGNLIRIWRPNDNNAFAVDCTDGGGDTQIMAFKDTVQSFSLLPKFGFAGFQLEVVGVNNAGSASNYFVNYVDNGNGSGYWSECPKQGIQYALDPTTMPHALRCNAPDVFEVVQLAWQPRICGDGVLTAANPGFIGRMPYDIFYHEGRLAILTDTTCDWSKAKQVYTFLPDTVQTELPDTPIGITLSAPDEVVLARRATQVNESLNLWAQRVQFRPNAGTVNPFQANTIQNPPSTAYEFSETGGFCKVGTSLYFAYEADSYATILKLVYQGGMVAGDVDVTAHVQQYIPSGVAGIAGSAVQKVLMVRCSGVAGQTQQYEAEGDNNLYVYNFLTQGDTLVQSAWNTWRLPTSTIVWHAIYRQYLYLGVQSNPTSGVTGGFFILTIPLNPSHFDTGYTDYLTRLDLRVTEAQCTVAYNSTTNITSITLPYMAFLEDQGFPPLMVGIRTTAGKFVRGQNVTVLTVTPDPAPATYAPTVLTVAGDLSAAQFYVGHQVSSEREESEFFQRTSAGIIPSDRLQIKEFSVSHDKTCYYRIEVEQGAGRATKIKELSTINSATVDTAEIGQAPALQKGTLKIGDINTEADKLQDTPHQR